MAGIQMWPEEIIALNEELATGYHPQLEKELQGMNDWAERFATIAAYCKVAMDGYYTSDQLVATAGHVLLPRLKQLRQNPNGMIIIGAD